MATIKSYTSLEQSKKLAEILPPESADMRYAPFGDTHPWCWDGHLLEKGAIPCWSLTALLGILPRGTRLLKSATDDTYHCGCIDKWYDSPIDACYEMILKLKGNDMESTEQKAKAHGEALERAKKLQQTEVLSGKMDWEPFLKNIHDVDKPLLTNLYNELAEFLMHHDGVVNADIGTDIVLFAAVRRLFCAGVRHIEFDGFVKSCSGFFSKYKTCLQRDDSDEWRGTCLYFFCSSYIFEMLNNGKYSIEEVLDGQSGN